jgi:hypothetical protein
MADFEPDAITFSATNALLLAQASQAAYLDQGRARPVLPDFSLPLQIRRSNNAASKERHVLGWIFIALDALFFPAGLAMAICNLYSARRHWSGGGNVTGSLSLFPASSASFFLLEPFSTFLRLSCSRAIR